MQGPQGPAGAATLAGAARTVPFCWNAVGGGILIPPASAIFERPFSFNHRYNVGLLPNAAANALVVQRPNTVVRRLAWSAQGAVYTGDPALSVAVRVYAASPGSSTFAPLPDFVVQTIPSGDSTAVQTNAALAPTLLQPGARITLVATFDNTTGIAFAGFRGATLGASIAIEEGAIA